MRGAVATRIMRSLKFLLGALAAVGVVVGVALHFLRCIFCASTRRHAACDAGSCSPERSTNASAPEEVQRLRAELRKRDQMLASLLAQARASSSDSGSAAGAAPATLPPGDRAIDILDERMFTAPKDPAKAAEMERAIREVASSPALAKAKIASLSCGSTFCKVILTAEAGSDVNQSMADRGLQPPEAVRGYRRAPVERRPERDVSRQVQGSSRLDRPVTTRSAFFP